MQGGVCAPVEGCGGIFIYLLFMFLHLIEFSTIVLGSGYKSRLSIGQDSPKTAAATDV